MKLEDFCNNKTQPRVLFITGAGISVDSGVPTFRTGKAIWKQFPVEQVCDIRNFTGNYDKAHDFYNKARLFLADKKPNEAHDFITQLQQKYGSDRVAVATTNVDLLHENSGTQNVLHLHGNITEMVINWKKPSEQCINIGCNHWDYKSQNNPSKPNIVFFHEATFYEDDVKKMIYSDLAWVLSSLNPDDLIFIIGSSNQVLNLKLIFSDVYGVTYNVNPVSYNQALTPEQANYLTLDHEILKNSTEAIPDIKQVLSDKLSMSL